MIEPPVLRLVAEYIARDVARFLRVYRPSETVVGEHEGDLVRVFDLEAEERAINLVRELLPRSVIVSEERGIVRLSSDPEYLVLIDPVDGSNNFAAGVPWCATSVAIAPISSCTLEGIVASAIASIHSDDVISYSITEGVLRNGEPLRRRAEPGNLIVVYADRLEEYAIAYAYYALFPNTKIRTFGSISLDLALLVKGSIEAVIDARGRLRNVDIAAVYPMLRAAGCSIEMRPRVENVELDRVVSGITLFAAFSSEYMERLRRAIDYARELREKLSQSS